MRGNGGFGDTLGGFGDTLGGFGDILRDFGNTLRSFGDTLRGFRNSFVLKEICDMRPCDCKTMRDLMDLKERSIKLNDQSIILGPPGVLLKIDPYVRINLTQDSFKRFAEWYLTDQSWE